MAYNEQVYGSDHDTSRDPLADDQGLAALRLNTHAARRGPSAEDRRAMEEWSYDAPDVRTVDELAADAEQFAVASAASRRKFNATRDERHLDALAFAAATVRRIGKTPLSEAQLYLAAYEAKRTQLGRAPQPFEREDLRAASRAMWDAMTRTQQNYEKSDRAVA